MLFPTVDRLGHLSIGDKIRIRNYCIPPCPPGRTGVHQKFVTYLQDYGNLFKIHLLIKVRQNDGLILTEEISSLHLEIFQVEKVLTGKRFLVLNCHGRNPNEREED